MYITLKCVLIFSKEENVTFCSSKCKILCKAGLNASETKTVCKQPHPPF